MSSVAGTLARLDALDRRLAAFGQQNLSIPVAPVRRGGRRAGFGLKRGGGGLSAAGKKRIKGIKVKAKSMGRAIMDEDAIKSVGGQRLPETSLPSSSMFIPVSRQAFTEAEQHKSVGGRAGASSDPRFPSTDPVEASEELRSTSRFVSAGRPKGSKGKKSVKRGELEIMDLDAPIRGRPPSDATLRRRLAALGGGAPVRPSGPSGGGLDELFSMPVPDVRLDRPIFISEAESKKVLNLRSLGGQKRQSGKNCRGKKTKKDLRTLGGQIRASGKPCAPKKRKKRSDAGKPRKKRVEKELPSTSKFIPMKRVSFAPMDEQVKFRKKSKPSSIRPSRAVKVPAKKAARKKRSDAGKVRKAAPKKAAPKKPRKKRSDAGKKRKTKKDSAFCKKVKACK